MSFWIQARELCICWGDDTRYWTWISADLPPPDESDKVAELRDVCWLDIKGIVNLKKLLIKTSYSAYLVFKLKERCRMLEKATARIRFVTEDKNDYVEVQECSVFIDRKKIPGERGRFPQPRGKGWMEVKLGEFYNNLGGGRDGIKVEAALLGVEGLHWKSGLIVRGIEFRPSYY